MSASPNLQLPYLDANQNQKSVTHNQALRMLDALVNLGVEASGLKAPPAAPADGQRWIVAPGATGAWAGKDLNLAAWQDGAWSFFAPGRGTLAYDAAATALLFWTGTAWRPVASLLALLGVTALGIGTAPDTTNPLSATLNAALFNALSTGAGGSGDVRVKLNKAGPGNTASFLFQDGFSGRAEIGLTGDDGLHVKVSPDGAAFVDALVLAAGGAATFLVPPSHPTPPPGDASTKSATTAFVAGAVAALVAAAPGALDTLKELADALGDDPNFAATVTTALAARAPLASPALTGTPTAPTPAPGDSGTRLATTGFVAAGYAGLDPLAISPTHPTLDYRLTAPDCLPPGQFSRLSTGYRTNAAGLLVPVAAGGLRIDHDPATGLPLGALIEEQRTNLLLFSQAFETAAWSSSALTVAADSVAAPDGTLTADRLTASGADGYSSQAVTLPAGPFTISLWSKSPDAGRVVNVVVQAGSTRLVASRQALSPAWQRFAASGTNPTSQSVSVYLGGDNTLPTGAVIDLWGAQLEAGAVPTSFIPTTGAQATRAADILVVPVTSDWFNANEGTVYVEATSPATIPANTYPTLFEIGDGSPANRYVCYLAGTSIYLAVFQGGSFAGSQIIANVQPGQPLRVAIAYGAGGKAMAVLGAAAGNNAMTLLSGLTRLSIGSSNGGAAVLGAQIRRLAYVPRALTPAQLQAMTA